MEINTLQTGISIENIITGKETVTPGNTAMSQFMGFVTHCLVVSRAMTWLKGQ